MPTLSQRAITPSADGDLVPLPKAGGIDDPNAPVSFPVNPSINRSFLPTDPTTNFYGPKFYPEGPTFSRSFPLTDVLNNNKATQALVTKVVTVSGGGSSTPVSAGANTSLSNLFSVAVNASLLPAVVNAIALGSALMPWQNLFIGLAQNQTASFDTSALSTNRIVKIPDAASTTAQAYVAVTHQFLISMSSSGVFASAQPAFTDISGTAAKAQLPATAVYTDQANTFGAFLQKFQAGNKLSLADPTDTTKIAQFDLSNIATATTRTVNIPDAASTTAQSIAALANKFVTQMSAQGVFTLAQPAASDLTGYTAINQTAQSANIGTATLYAVPGGGAGLYQITIFIIVTQAGSVSSTLPQVNITWTDQDSAATITQSAVTPTNAGNTTSTFQQATFVVNAAASSNIQYATAGYASAGGTAMNYAIRIRSQYLG